MGASLSSSRKTTSTITPNTTSSTHIQSSTSSHSPSDVDARISRARKIGALDLSHNLHLVALPNEALDLPALRRIDLSFTSLSSIPILPEESLKKLDFFSATNCKLCGQQPSLKNARVLTQLILDNNDRLTAQDLSSSCFQLPSQIKNFSLASCRRLGSIPTCLLGNEGKSLLCLEKLDLSGCGINSLPSTLITVGATLVELILDDNSLSSLNLCLTSTPIDDNDTGNIIPTTWSSFVKLSILSVRRNKLTPTSDALPKELFSETKLSVLSLGGNTLLTASAVLKLPGCADFEKRRAARMSKAIINDIQADRSFCGLDRIV
jgi:Leucine-rich repeat (LRR) protein